MGDAMNADRRSLLHRLYKKDALIELVVELEGRLAECQGRLEESERRCGMIVVEITAAQIRCQEIRERQPSLPKNTPHTIYNGPVTMHQDNRRTNLTGNAIIGSTLNWGEISGRVRNSVKQLPPKPADGPDLAGILQALIQSIDEALEAKKLKEQDAADAADAVEEIAEAAKTPDRPGMLERASKAVRNLARIATGAAVVSEKVGDLQDAVAGWFRS